jgi:polyhydroxybutyrate depolymerase
MPRQAFSRLKPRSYIRRLLLTCVGLIAALVLGLVIAFRLANHTNGTLLSSGEQRAYLLYVPESYDPATPTPLVITFHGFAQWPAHQAQLSHWNELADQYGFIVVYPSGRHVPLRWQTGGTFARNTDPQTDITFVSDLIDKLATEYNLDPARIYANGMSNGAGMSFILFCALSDRIAAVGLVAGAYLYTWEECQPERQVPAVVFHGTDDPIVPFQGGRIRPFDVPFPAIPDWIDTLAGRNACDKVPEALPASGDVSGVQYQDCAADVVFYTVAGGGHTWPGGDRLPVTIAGHTSQNIDATQTMWDFFQEHPLPER